MVKPITWSWTCFDEVAVSWPFFLFFCFFQATEKYLCGYRIALFFYLFVFLWGFFGGINLGFDLIISEATVCPKCQLKNTVLKLKIIKRLISYTITADCYL